MSKVSSNSTKIWLDGWDLTGYLNAAELDIKQMVPSVQCFGDVGPKRIVDTYDSSQKLGGFFDAAANAIDPDVFAMLSTIPDHALTLSFGAALEGSIAYTVAVQLTDEKIAVKVGQAILLDFGTVESATLSRAVVFRSAALSAAGNGAGQDQGVSNAGQLYAVHFHLFAFTGTSVTLKLQDSANNSTFADITGLADSGALTTPGAVRVSTTLATRRYKRVVASGTFSAALIGVAGGIVAQQ